MRFELLYYNWAIRTYWLGIFLVSFVNAKAGLWISGRRNYERHLTRLGDGKRIWFHCASLGEFEQARPVIEWIKTYNPEAQIIITFFSPSGYEVRKTYSPATAILYLPLDTKSNAKKFIQEVKPDIALFVKYELWYNFINQLRQAKVPVILFSSVFRPDQIYFKWYTVLFREILSMFNYVLVQNQRSQDLLASINVKSEIAFDTRFDRVLSVARNKRNFPAIEVFKGNHKIFIAGSSWPKDEKLIAELINHRKLPGYKFIIAPHNIDAAQVADLIASLKLTTRKLSELTEDNAAETEVVVVDSFGQLVWLYAYGNIGYVGGGFDNCVHNVLEPAVYGMPVFFGPNNRKSVEAGELMALQAAYSVNTIEELESRLQQLLTNPHKLNAASAAAKNYVAQHEGGTARVLEKIREFIPIK